jgi:predicted flap endonuclease-1-like 5' DNA nuclease
MNEQETNDQQSEDGSVTLQAKRAPDPEPAPEAVQTPAPNTDTVVDHIKSVGHSLLQSLETAGIAHHQKLDAIARNVDAKFDCILENFDAKHREAVRGMALNVASEIEGVKVAINGLLTEVRTLAVVVNSTKNSQ